MVIKLDHYCLPSVEQVGGKARNLVLLRKYGLPVPPGFCLTCTAYEHHVNERLSSELHNAIRKLQKAKKTNWPKVLAGIRRLITTQAIDPYLAEELQKYHKKLKAQLIAVRSSATAEDQAQLSFAGQYETVLNVNSFEGLQSAVKKCWASLWSERAYEYCRKNSIDHASLKMAVIVQQQVPADFAGVAFTADPATGRQDRVMIEYVQGMGQRLVSGHATPDRVTVAKRGGKILEITAADRGLDRSLIKKLSQQAVRIEKKFGGPQDIEWALAGKRLFFLQTRPITATNTISKEDRQIYTNANTGEVIPDVTTPMTWSLAVPVINCIFSSFLSIFGVDMGDLVIIKRICGRVYFNLTTLVGMLRTIPGFKRFNLTAVFGGEQGSMGDMANLTIVDEDIPKVRFRISRGLIILPLRIMRLLTYDLASGAKKIKKALADVERLDRTDIKAMTDSSLLEMLGAVVGKVIASLHESAFLATSMLYYANLDKLCQKWFRGKPGEYANQLLAGVGDIEPAKAGLALYWLSRVCRQHPAVLRHVSGRESWHALRPRISRVKGGGEFLKAWQDFMTKYGHHTRSEIELIYPRWCETPDYVLDMVRNYLRKSDTAVDPVENYDRVIERRVKLTAELRAKLKNPVKRFLFNFYLKKAQPGVVLRENTKNMYVRAWLIIRRIVLELGNRLSRRRIISRADDIFFLEREEIGPLVKHACGAEVRRLIRARRREYELYKTITPPKVIRGIFDPLRYKTAPVAQKQRVLTGLAVSPGIVRGKARVILDTRSREKVRPGEILVAPFTDPGWTPYFMSAAAIVVDMGGLFSHGSIVAREYGIPAVVNVGPATKVIKTGQALEVDGDRGIVRIFAKGEIPKTAIPLLT